MSELHKVEFVKAAEEDLADIGEYILKENPSAATRIRIIDHIHRSLSQLSSFPYMGREPDDNKLVEAGYRVLVIDKYLVFYKVLDCVIEIRRIIHSSKLRRVLLR